MIGALNGVNSAGAIIGCLTSAWSADAWGRKRTIQLGCAILVVGGALCSGSVSIGMFIAGRVIAGVGAGILAVVVPMYQGEVSTAETRGAMMCVTGIMYAFGYVRHSTSSQETIDADNEQTWAGWMGTQSDRFVHASPRPILTLVTQATHASTSQPTRLPPTSHGAFRSPCSVCRRSLYSRVPNLFLSRQGGY